MHFMFEPKKILREALEYLNFVLTTNPFMSIANTEAIILAKPLV